MFLLKCIHKNWKQVKFTSLPVYQFTCLQPIQKTPPLPPLHQLQLSTIANSQLKKKRPLTFNVTNVTLLDLLDRRGSVCTYICEIRRWVGGGEGRQRIGIGPGCIGWNRSTYFAVKVPDIGLFLGQKGLVALATWRGHDVIPRCIDLVASSAEWSDAALLGCPRSALQ